jgi:hypothetical protein
VALLRCRPDHGHELPDVWGASGADRPGFRGMTPSEIAVRLIARRLGFAPETGHERVGDLLTDARRAREAAAPPAG